MTVENMTQYLVNPDVSCRREGPKEGAILFNPDTDAILVVNPVGLLIWEALEQPRTQAEVVAYVSEHCENVPAGEVAADVDAFLQSLQPGSFIGNVLETDTN